MSREELSGALERYEDILMMRASRQAVLEADRAALTLIDRLGSTHREAMNSEGLSGDERCLIAFHLSQLQPDADDHLNYSESTREEIRARWRAGDHVQALEDLKEMLDCASYHESPRHELAWFTDQIKAQTQAQTQAQIQAQTQEPKEQAVARAQRHAGDQSRGLDQLIALDEAARVLLELYTSYPLTAVKRLEVDVVRSQLYELWRESWIITARVHHDAARWGGEWVALSLAHHPPSCALRPLTCVASRSSSRDFDISDQLNEARTRTRARAQALIHTQVKLDTVATPRVVREAVADLITQDTRDDEAEPSSARTMLHAMSRALFNFTPPSKPDQRSAQESTHSFERWALKEERAQCAVTQREIKGEVRYLDHHREVPSTRHKLALKAVESQQELLEKTQAQREELERSLTHAHQRLQTLIRSGEDLIAKLSQARRALDQLKTRERTLREERSGLAGQIGSAERVIAGPPTDVEVERGGELQRQLEALSQEIKALNIKLEIEAEVKREHQGKTEREREEVTRLSQYLARITAEEEEQNAKLESLELELKALPSVEREPVYSVFRYPITEHTTSCTLKWEGALSGSSPSRPSRSSHSTLGAQPSWRSEASVNLKATYNQAFPRYGIQRVKPNLKRLEERARSRLRQTLASRFTLWFEARGERRLIEVASPRVSSLLSQPASALSAERIELLALLTHIDADTFAISLSRALAPQLGHRLQTRSIAPLLMWDAESDFEL